MFTKNVGIVARLFSTKEEDVPRRVELAQQLLEAATSVRLQNQKGSFKRIDLVVWADPKYESDCGMTAAALRKMVQARGYKDVYVSGEVHADLFCGLLNRATARQSRGGCDYVMFLSPEASSYLTQSNMDLMWGALAAGAKVTGLAISEITDSILEGRIGNSCAIWEIESLLAVGGFDLEAKKPTLDEERYHAFVRGAGKDGHDRFYHLAGVEEMIPLARLVKEYGACIAPILPTDESQVYIVPDRETQPELWQRHWNKIATKDERQVRHLARECVETTYLKDAGVMPAYRHPRVYGKRG